MLYTLRFSLQNAVCFIMLASLIPVLFTFYIQGVLKLKKNNSGAKGLSRLLCHCAGITQYSEGRWPSQESGFVTAQVCKL